VNAKMNESDKREFNKEFGNAMTYGLLGTLYERVENRVKKKQMKGALDDLLNITNRLFK
jgi:hypothetical protein